MLTLLITIPLLFATPPAPELENPEYGAALEHLRAADSDANRDPVAASETLAQAILALEQFAPQLSGDTEARELRQFARLNLARAYLLAEQDELATQVMDEAVREAMGDPLPAADFGPSLEQLYAQRVEALEQLGRASLVVNCGMPCNVYVDERDVGPEPPPLLLGSYRVWIEDTNGKRSAMREPLELSEAGQVYELEFAPIRSPVRPAPAPPLPTRIMPRWAEVTLIVTGIGLTTTGAVLIGIDSTGTGTEGRAYNTLPAGALSTVVGLGALLPGVITLSIDERRLAGKRERAAIINWTMQF